MELDAKSKVGASTGVAETIAARAKKIVDEFQAFQDWEARYNHLIQIGKALPEMPESKRLDDFKVKGCQSQVWLYAHKNPSGEIEYDGDSDALLVRGLVALLLRVYSGAKPDDIISSKPDFVQEIGLGNALSPSRANGLMAMIKQIKFYAIALNVPG